MPSTRARPLAPRISARTVPIARIIATGTSPTLCSWACPAWTAMLLQMVKSAATSSATGACQPSVRRASHQLAKKPIVLNVAAFSVSDRNGSARSRQKE